MTGRPPKKLRWILVGVGAAVGLHLLIGVAVVAAGFARSASDVRSMAAPQSVRLSSTVTWTVGTCLAERSEVSCASGHDAEVVAVVPVTDDLRDGRRRWGANSSCAREVAAVIAAGEFRPDTVTYASAYPPHELHDERVFCLLVAPDDSPMRGSWTGGDLLGPTAPAPFE
ncbi:hypothetical protein OG218_22850 [Kineococcus sp. NBC_00420]|uniref:hypothetical protein n=1 Tax=unclassified Kineococcus TaxID=2621656 RepID=UPI002E2224FF